MAFSQSLFVFTPRAVIRPREEKLCAREKSRSYTPTFQLLQRIPGERDASGGRQAGKQSPPVPEDRADRTEQPAPHLPPPPHRVPGILWLTSAGVRGGLPSLGVLLILSVGILSLLDPCQQLRLGNGSVCTEKEEEDVSPALVGERLSSLHPPTFLRWETNERGLGSCSHPSAPLTLCGPWMQEHTLLRRGAPPSLQREEDSKKRHLRLPAGSPVFSSPLRSADPLQWGLQLGGSTRAASTALPVRFPPARTAPSYSSESRAARGFWWGKGDNHHLSSGGERKTSLPDTWEALGVKFHLCSGGSVCLTQEPNP